MAVTNVKILLRRGTRSEISGNTLDAGELGYTTDTNQLYVGTDAMDDEIVFDPFANAHAIVQSYLDTLSAPFTGLEIDEDLIIKNIPIVTITAGAFVVGSVYTIKTLGTDTLIPVTAGAFVIGTEYTILTAGTTDFTLIGSADSVVGTTFTATGVGVGTGTATYISTSIQDHWNTAATTSAVVYAVGDTFTATTVGTGTGTVTCNGADYLISEMSSSTTFDVSIFGSQRRNVEVLTENSFSQAYANMHLQTHTAADGRRPDLFKKNLLINDGSTPSTVGTFLKYDKTDCTSFFIDYSLKQTDATNTFIRVGTIRVINGEAISPPLTGLVKLTDDNTEIWQDTGINSATAGSFVIGTRYKIVTAGTTDFTLIGATDSNVGTVFTATGIGAGTGTATYADNIAQSEEFSNIEFASVIDGTNMKINYTQDANFTTEISYTVKRWTM